MKKINYLELKWSRIFCINILFIFLSIRSAGQDINGYILSRGKNICKAAHLTNDLIKGYVDSKSGYSDVYIYSNDNFLSRKITTKLRLIHGFGNLYIKDLQVLYDDDIADPFAAFGKTAKLLVDIHAKVEPEKHQEIRNEIIRITGTDMYNWSGRIWALYYINLDYFDYIMSR